MSQRSMITPGNDDPAALQRRERAAWESAYSLHRSAVYGCIAALMPRDRQLVEEVHQQVWLAAIESIAGFEPAKGDFRAWICGIARRRAAGHYRQRTHVSVSNEDSLPQDAALLPADVAEQVELGAQVRAAVATLADESQAILHAKYVDGMSVNEIAAERGKTPKAVESLLSRARQRLRELLHSDDSSSHATVHGRIR